MSEGVTITVNAESEAAAAKLQQFFDGAIAGVEKLSGAARFLTEFAGQIIAAFSVSALVAFTREAINAAEAMGQLSRQVGFSLQTLSALKSQANSNGIQFEELRLGLTHFNAMLNEARTHGGQVLDTFRNLSDGLAAAVVEGKPAEEVYRMLAERFKQLPDGIQKSAAAQQLFGRASAQWVSLLNEGAKGLDRIKEIGGGITPEMVANATQFNRTLREWHENFEIAFQDLAGKILPTLLKMQTLPAIFANAWRDGKLPELIGLMIEAGFELGAIAIKKGWVALWESLTGATAGQIYLTLFDAVMNFGVSAAQFLIKVLTEPVIYMAATFDWLGSHIKEMFVDAINFFITKWNSTVAKIPGFNDPFIKFGTIDKRGADSFQESLADMQKLVDPLSKGATDYLTNTLQQAKEILGVNQKLSAADDTHASALQRINALINEQLKAIQIVHSAMTATGTGGTTGGGTTSQKIKLQNEELEYLRQSIGLQKEKIATDPTLTQSERLKKMLPALVDEAALIKMQVNLQKSVVSSKGTTEEERLNANKEIVKLQLQQIQLTRQIATASHPWVTAWAQVVQHLREMHDLAQTTAKSFEGVFNSAIDSISQNLSKVIEGTERWGQALRNIGTSILDELISAVVKLAVQTVISMVATAIFGEALSEAASAAYAAAWSGPAVLATIASYGGAAAAAPGEVMAAMAFAPAISSLAVAAREHGGPGSRGIPNLVGERGPELYVPQSDGHYFNAVDTTRIMDFMRSSGSSSKAAAEKPVNLAVHLWDSEERMREHIKHDTDTHHTIIDLVRNRFHQINAGT